ncbi:MAG: HEAT repeat domain-containing protein [bacterium]|nr:HEAT repeat domain-containing protein [bacterium]
MNSYIYTDPMIRLVVSSGLFVLCLAITMLFVVFLMRLNFMLKERRRNRFLSIWRPLLAASLDTVPEDLPAVRSGDAVTFLFLWNYYQESLLGEANEKLNEVARRVGIDRVAIKLLYKKGIRQKLMAISTLGHLEEKAARERLYEFAESANSALSLAAFKALVQIEKEDAMPVLMPLLSTRTDWSLDMVASILKSAPADALVKPLGQVALNAPGKVQPRLIRFLEATGSAEIRQCISAILHSATRSEVISACLHAIAEIGDPRDLELVRQHVSHQSWFVRVQAARALGKIGIHDDEQRLIEMLHDMAWWVRYRAAQSLAALPFVSTRRFKEIQGKETNMDVRGILAQVMLEEGML